MSETENKVIIGNHNAPYLAYYYILKITAAIYLRILSHPFHRYVRHVLLPGPCPLCQKIIILTLYPKKPHRKFEAIQKQLQIWKVHFYVHPESCSYINQSRFLQEISVYSPIISHYFSSLCAAQLFRSHRFATAFPAPVADNAINKLDNDRACVELYEGESPTNDGQAGSL